MKSYNNNVTIDDSPKNKDEIIAQLEGRKRIKSIAGSQKQFICMNRTFNVAWRIYHLLQKVSEETLDLLLCFKIDKTLLPYVREYEKQLMLCKINPEKFRKELYFFLSKMADKIIENKDEKLILEFYNVIVQTALKKDYYDDSNIQNVFDAYLSLIAQQITFFYDDTKFELYGIRRDGSLLLQIDKTALIDYYQYDMEIDVLQACLDKENGKRTKIDLDKSFQKVLQRFREGGFAVSDMKDIEVIIQASNNHNNNLLCCCYYIDEYSQDFISNGINTGRVNFEFPRKWLDTEEYKKALRKRSYTLPASGVTAKFDYAEGIKEITFKEIFKDDKIIMLYKIRFVNESVVCGYYDIEEELFYSIFEMTSGFEYGEKLENFVLENYYLLTCKNIEKEKKQRLMIIVNNDATPLDKIIRWNKQPVVEYSTIHYTEGGESTGSRKKYHKGDYFTSKVEINAMVRKLPAGYNASEEAKNNAERYGIELEEGYTFVLPFERNQRHIMPL